MGRPTNIILVNDNTPKRKAVKHNNYGSKVNKC